MAKIEKSNAEIFKYEFDIPINKPAQTVWSLLTTQINDWWMNDFRALGEGSNITFDHRQGGNLIETGVGGETLEWYRVQMCIPKNSLYLVGYMAPDWGGPTVSMLKLALKENGETCVLTVSDALLGNISEKKAQSAKEGWQLLFGEGFKHFVET